MSETTVEYMSRLQEEREHLLQRIVRLREDVKVELEFEADEGDPELPERERNLSLLATFEERLTDLNRAMDKLRDGGYGFCKSCGNPIDPERLAIVPETEYCVTCKSKLERRSRRQ